MRDMEKKDIQKKTFSKGRVAALLVTAAAAVILALVLPDRRQAFLEASWKFFLEMLIILPAITVMIGLFSVFVPKELITKHLGESSGFKGFLLSLGLGMLPAGPLYVAFPVAAALLAKGARRANIIVFLTAWACIKLPQEMMEFTFMGPAFTFTRLALTVIAAALMGFLTERIMAGGQRYS
ncbi:MAG: permease [Spirochaetales bacterium]|nr:permease [Spirochaetales bacterium]